MCRRRSITDCRYTIAFKGPRKRFSRKDSKKGCGQMFKHRLPQVKGNHCLISLILIIALATFACEPTCPGDPECPPDKERVVVIFSDVTSSLLKKESEQVASITCEI